MSSKRVKNDLHTTNNIGIDHHMNNIHKIKTHAKIDHHTKTANITNKITENNYSLITLINKKVPLCFIHPSFFTRNIIISAIKSKFQTTIINVLEFTDDPSSVISQMVIDGNEFKTVHGPLNFLIECDNSDTAKNDHPRIANNINKNHHNNINNNHVIVVLNTTQSIYYFLQPFFSHHAFVFFSQHHLLLTNILPIQVVFNTPFQLITDIDAYFNIKSKNFQILEERICDLYYTSITNHNYTVSNSNNAYYYNINYAQSTNKNLYLVQRIKMYLLLSLCYAHECINIRERVNQYLRELLTVSSGDVERYLIDYVKDVKSRSNTQCLNDSHEIHNLNKSNDFIRNNNKYCKSNFNNSDCKSNCNKINNNNEKNNSNSKSNFNKSNFTTKTSKKDLPGYTSIPTFLSHISLAPTPETIYFTTDVFSTISLCLDHLICIEGATGTGKTTSLQLICREVYGRFKHVNCSSDGDVSDYIGNYQSGGINDRNYNNDGINNKGGHFYTYTTNNTNLLSFTPGPFLTAILSNTPFLFDEMNLLTNDVSLYFISIVEQRVLFNCNYNNSINHIYFNSPIFANINLTDKRPLPPNHLHIHINDIATNQHSTLTLLNSISFSTGIFSSKQQLSQIFFNLKNNIPINIRNIKIVNPVNYSIRTLIRLISNKITYLSVYDILGIAVDDYGIVYDYDNYCITKSINSCNIKSTLIEDFHPIENINHKNNSTLSHNSNLINNSTLTHNPTINHNTNNNKFIITNNIKSLILQLHNSISNNIPVLLIGNTSTGKTSLIKYISQLYNKSLIRINNHRDIDKYDYLGSTIINNNHIINTIGPLLNCINNNNWLLIDEINLCNSDVLEILNRLLDDNKEIEHNGIIYKINNDFRIFATMNDTNYTGRNKLSEAFMNRWNIKNVSVDVEEILERVYSNENVTKNVSVSVSENVNKSINESVTKSVSANHIENESVNKTVSVTKNDINNSINNKQLVKSFLLSLYNHLILLRNYKSLITLRDIFKIITRYNNNNNILSVTYDYLVYKQKDTKNKELIKSIIKEKYVKVYGEYNEVDEEDKEIRVDIIDRIKSINTYSDTILNNDFFLSHSHIKTINLILKALLNNENVLLIGETGIGKTKLVEIIGKLINKEVVSICCNGSMDTNDLIGQYVISDCTDTNDTVNNYNIDTMNGSTTVDDHTAINSNTVNINTMNNNTIVDSNIVNSNTMNNNTNSTNTNNINVSFKLSTLVQSITNNSIILLDEINLPDSAVIERLNSILDSNEIYINEINKNIQNNSIIIATMNPSHYNGKKELSMALLNRFTVIYFEFKEYDEILNHMIGKTINKEFYEIIKNKVLNNNDLSIRKIEKLRDFLNCNKVNKETINDALEVTGIIECKRKNDIVMIEDKERIKYGNYELLKYTNQYDCKYYHINNNCNLFTDTVSNSLNQQFNHSLNDTMNKEINYNQSINPLNHQVNKSINKLQVNHNYTPITNIFTLQTYNFYLLIRALSISKNILIEGLPGIGKTSIIYELGKIMNKNVERVNLGEGTEYNDLIGNYLPFEDDTIKHNIIFKYVESSFIRALRDNDIIILDEINLCTQSVLEGLNSLFDYRKYIKVNDEIIKSDSIIIGTMNPYNYKGRNKLPQSFLDRFIIINFSEYDKNEINTILKDDDIIKLYTKYQLSLRECLRAQLIGMNIIKKKNVKYSISNDRICIGETHITYNDYNKECKNNDYVLLSNNIKHVETVINCLYQNIPIIIDGIGGGEKMIKFVSKLMKMRLKNVYLHSGMDSNDLLGQYVKKDEIFEELNDNSKIISKFEWKDSELISSLLNYDITVIHNTEILNTNILDRLNSLLDSKKLNMIEKGKNCYYEFGNSRIVFVIRNKESMSGPFIDRCMMVKMEKWSGIDMGRVLWMNYLKEDGKWDELSSLIEDGKSCLCNWSNDDEFKLKIEKRSVINFNENNKIERMHEYECNCGENNICFDRLKIRNNKEDDYEERSKLHDGDIVDRTRNFWENRDRIIRLVKSLLFLSNITISEEFLNNLWLQMKINDGPAMYQVIGKMYELNDVDFADISLMLPNMVYENEIEGFFNYDIIKLSKDERYFVRKYAEIEKSVVYDFSVNQAFEYMKSDNQYHFSQSLIYLDAMSACDLKRKFICDEFYRENLIVRFNEEYSGMKYDEMINYLIKEIIQLSDIKLKYNEKICDYFMMNNPHYLMLKETDSLPDIRKYLIEMYKYSSCGTKIKEKVENFIKIANEKQTKRNKLLKAGLQHEYDKIKQWIRENNDIKTVSSFNLPFHPLLLLFSLKIMKSIRSNNEKRKLQIFKKKILKYHVIKESKNKYPKFIILLKKYKIKNNYSFSNPFALLFYGIFFTDNSEGYLSKFIEEQIEKNYQIEENYLNICLKEKYSILKTGVNHIINYQVLLHLLISDWSLQSLESFTILYDYLHFLTVIFFIKKIIQSDYEIDNKQLIYNFSLQYHFFYKEERMRNDSKKVNVLDFLGDVEINEKMKCFNECEKSKELYVKICCKLEDENTCFCVRLFKLKDMDKEKLRKYIEKSKTEENVSKSVVSSNHIYNIFYNRPIPLVPYSKNDLLMGAVFLEYVRRKIENEMIHLLIEIMIENNLIGLTMNIWMRMNENVKEKKVECGCVEGKGDCREKNEEIENEQNGDELDGQDINKDFNGKDGDIEGRLHENVEPKSEEDTENDEKEGEQEIQHQYDNTKEMDDNNNDETQEMDNNDDCTQEINDLKNDMPGVNDQQDDTQEMDNYDNHTQEINNQQEEIGDVEKCDSESDPGIRENAQIELNFSFENEISSTEHSSEDGSVSYSTEELDPNQESSECANDYEQFSNNKSESSDNESQSCNDNFTELNSSEYDRTQDKPFSYKYQEKQNNNEEQSCNDAIDYDTAGAENEQGQAKGLKETDEQKNDRLKESSTNKQEEKDQNTEEIEEIIPIGKRIDELLRNIEMDKSLTMRLENILFNKRKYIGDFRTGKKLNLKRIPEYIASNYRKDKIWLRKRSDENILIRFFIDNTTSMINYDILEMISVFEKMRLSLNELRIKVECYKFGEKYEKVKENEKSNDTEINVYEYYHQFINSFTFNDRMTSYSFLNDDHDGINIVLTDGIISSAEEMKNDKFLFLIFNQKIIELEVIEYKEGIMERRKYLEGFKNRYEVINDVEESVLLALEEMIDRN